MNEVEIFIHFYGHASNFNSFYLKLPSQLAKGLGDSKHC